VITVYNGSTSSLWMVDSSGSPDLTMTGDTITQESGVAPGVVTDATSRALYGDQPISLPSNRWVQTKSFGWGMAMAVAGDLAQPQPVFTALPIPGDPRLEFFDRVAVSDPDNTGAQLDVWYVGGTHGVDASGSYVQQLVARPARNRFLAGTGLVGIDLVG
jgi:hypothetical protein